MPFYGKDWRGPGDEWIKNATGYWDSVKNGRRQLFEMLTYETMLRKCRQSMKDSSAFGRRLQSESGKDNDLSPSLYMPHLVVKTNVTKESAAVTSLTDALLRLDMRMAIQDTRRFHFVCRLLELLLKDKLHILGGRSQLFLMDLLKWVCKAVIDSGNNIKVLRNLLRVLRCNLKENQYEHVGSQQLWCRHEKTAEDIEYALNIFDHTSSPESSLSSSPSLHDLPSPCLLRILTHLTDPEDLESAIHSDATLAHIVEEGYLYENLASERFSYEQLRTVVPTGQSLDDCNWSAIYRRLMRRYGAGLVYSCKLHHCEYCSAVYWPIYGHPCANEEGPTKYRILSPEQFIALFPI